MTKFSLKDMPEIFVSDTGISKAVSEAVARGKLRKLASRLYTKNLDEAPERIVRRNWYYLITGYFPDAVISDRTAIENGPALDGSIFLIAAKKRDVELPGLMFRPRKGPAALESDRPFIGGARLASTARAYLENMRTSRPRSGKVARTLSRSEMEERLDAMIRRQGEDAVNELRDEARRLAPVLELEKEGEALSELIGSLLGTREGGLQSALGKARLAGKPFDPDRIELFEILFGALRETVPVSRPVGERSTEENANLSFFEAYFSNFIEGTEFTVEEAEEIVFGGVIPQERPADAHDILGTYRIVSDPAEMRIRPGSFDEMIDLIRRRHAVFMERRSDANPGTFKTRENRAGGTLFVAPDLVLGTLEKGFAFLDGLEAPAHRAAFMMFLVSEVHPFADGNGRAARIMTNAEFIAGGEERIIIPTVYRDNYLSALRALSRTRNAQPVIRVLDFAQAYAKAIDWSGLEGARRMLEQTNAFSEGDDVRLVMPAAAAPLQQSP